MVGDSVELGSGGKVGERYIGRYGTGEQKCRRKMKVIVETDKLFIGKYLVPEENRNGDGLGLCRLQ